MKKLQDGGVIYDFIVSVIELNKGDISISTGVKISLADDFVLSQIITATKEYESGFDRAMKGI